MARISKKKKSWADKIEPGKNYAIDEALALVSPDGDTEVDPNCGYWRKPWSQAVQGHWLEAVMHIAMSKPYIEAVVWHEVVDHPDIELPLSGLMTEDLTPKSAFRHISAFRKALNDGEPMKPTKMETQLTSTEAFGISDKNNGD